MNSVNSKKTLFLSLPLKTKRMILENVDIVTDISKADFQEKYFKKQKPLLIKNYSSRWAAFDQWNLENIREKACEQ